MREVHIFPHIPENLAFGAGNLPLGNEAFPSPQIHRTTWTAICELPRNLAYARITRISNKPPYLNKKILCKSL
jgi:hypothetical protein